MNETTLTNNRVLKYLEKNPEDITREDLVDFVVNNGVEMINFMYPAADGRLKTLNFVINDLDYLNTILTSGERVDGSSLFPGFIEAGNSDLYVIPRYSTAFLDPFAEIPTLSMLCNFFDKDGNELASSPDVPCAARALNSVRPQALNSRPWANWSITSSRLTRGCFPQATSAVTMNRPRLPNSTISAHGACSI